MYLTPHNSWAPQPSVSSQSSLVATHTLAADVTLLTLSCESVDVANYKRMLASIEQVLESGHRVILDLGSVSFMDSSGLGALVSGTRTARRFGGEMAICSLTPDVRTLFELVQLDKVVQVYNDRDEALRSLGLPPDTS